MKSGAEKVVETLSGLAAIFADRDPEFLQEKIIGGCSVIPEDESIIMFKRKIAEKSIDLEAFLKDYGLPKSDIDVAIGEAITLVIERKFDSIAAELLNPRPLDVERCYGPHYDNKQEYTNQAQAVTNFRMNLAKIEARKVWGKQLVEGAPRPHHAWPSTASPTGRKHRAKLGEAKPHSAWDMGA